MGVGGQQPEGHDPLAIGARIPTDLPSASDPLLFARAALVTGPSNSKAALVQGSVRQQPQAHREGDEALQAPETKH